MNGRVFTRRRLLRTAGASVVLGLGGCLKQNGDTSDDSQPNGFAPQNTSSKNNGSATKSGSATQTVDESSFPTRPTRGVSVPLAPTNVVYDWYRNREARFADARGKKQYKKAHIKGAVLSPAPNGQTSNDPVENWPKSDRIVTYCRCPHHLSSLRAATLINQGYERVYALDKGFDHWSEKGYPVAGSNVETQPKVRTITGATDPKFAGKTAWAFHHDSGQREATGIEQNGHYTLNLPFYDVTDDSMIEIKTPGYTIEKSLGVLTRGSVTPTGTLSMNTRRP